MPFDSIQELIVRTRVEQLDALAEQRQAIDLKIEEIASSERYREKVARLMCLRGIDVQSAMGLLMEVIDAHRFATAPQPDELLRLGAERAFFGGEPPAGRHYQGGAQPGQVAWNQQRKPRRDSRWRKHWKTQPEAVVRIARKAEKRLHDKYWKIAMRKDTKKAATAVAREMAGFVWAILTVEAA